MHIPTIRAHYGIGESALGLAMLAAGIGALVGLTQAGRLIARHGTRRVALSCGIALALGIACLLVLPGYPALLALLVVFGIANGLFDVAINAEAAALEQRDGRSLMSGMHGMFSTGGMAGAACGSALLALGIAAQLQLACVALAMAAAVALASSCMSAAPNRHEEHHAGAGFRLPRGMLLALGVLAGVGLLAEGAMYDWSVLYLQQELGSPQEQAALAYAAFSAAMATTRFCGDWARSHIAAPMLLRASAALAAAGMALMLVSRDPRLALAGCALAGIGFANIVPILFSAAATATGTTAASAIATVSSLGYLGFMCGPPLIGFVASGSSLTAALWLVVGAALVLGSYAGRVVPRPVPS